MKIPIKEKIIKIFEEIKNENRKDKYYFSNDLENNVYIEEPKDFLNGLTYGIIHEIYDKDNKEFCDDLYLQLLESLNDIYNNYHKIYGKHIDESSYLFGKLETLLQIVTYVKEEKLTKEDLYFFNNLYNLDIDLEILKQIYLSGRVELDYLKYIYNIDDIAEIKLKEKLNELIKYNLIYKEDNDSPYVKERYLTTKKTRTWFTHYFNGELTNENKKRIEEKNNEKI